MMFRKFTMVYIPSTTTGNYNDKLIKIHSTGVLIRKCQNKFINVKLLCMVIQKFIVTQIFVNDIILNTAMLQCVFQRLSRTVFCFCFVSNCSYFSYVKNSIKNQISILVYVGSSYQRIQVLFQ